MELNQNTTQPSTSFGGRNNVGTGKNKINSYILNLGCFSMLDSIRKTGKKRPPKNYLGLQVSYLFNRGMLKKATLISLLGLSSAMNVGFCSITYLLHAFFRYGSNLFKKKKLNITVFAHNKNKMQESLIIILLVFKLPQILIRNGLLKKIVVAHDMREVYEHGG